MENIDITQVTENEEEAFLLFKRKHELQYPYPTKHTVNKGLGTQFWIYFLVSISQVVLAALRTADQFYKAAFLSGNGEWFAWTESVVSLIAVEGGLVVLATIRASNKKEYSEKSSNIGIAMMVSISTLAGLGQSINLITNIDKTILLYLQYTLAIVLGIGVTAIALIGGDVLGSLIVKSGERVQDNEREYEKVLKKYNDDMIVSWNRSDEKKIVRGDIKGVARSFVRSTERGRTNGLRLGDNEKSKKIKEYIENSVSNSGEEPGPSEISREVGVTKSYAHKVLHDWMEERPTIADISQMSPDEKSRIAQFSIDELMAEFNIPQKKAEIWKRELYNNGFKVKLL